MTTSQKRPDEMVDILRPDFFGRSEPNAAWVHACSAFTALPALRAFWPMSSVDYTNPQARDVSGGAYHLTNNNVSLFGYDQLAPYVEFNGTTQYLSRADGGAANWADIIGTEAYVESTQRGLTVGGWFRFDNAAAAVEGLIAKDVNVVATASYSLRRSGAGNAVFRIGDGIAFVQAVIAGTAQNTWHWIAGRFTPSAEVKVWLDIATATNVVAVPAALNDSATDFRIGRLAGFYLDGKTSLCFLCAAALSDTLINQMYYQTKTMFNV